MARKPWPRSATQLLKSAGVIWLGVVRRGLRGGEELDGVGLVDYLLGAAEGEGVGGVGGGEAGGLVLDEDVAAVAGEVDEGLRGGAVEVGVGGVGADAEDDRVEAGELGCG